MDMVPSAWPVSAWAGILLPKFIVGS